MHALFALCILLYKLAHTCLPLVALLSAPPADSLPPSFSLGSEALYQHWCLLELQQQYFLAVVIIVVLLQLLLLLLDLRRLAGSLLLQHHCCH